MSRTCAYIVNESPFFLEMAANSISMLREHSSDPVTVFLIEDGGEGTKHAGRDYTFDVTENSEQVSEQFAQLMSKLNVTLKRRKPIDEFVHLNRIYLSECPEDQVLYIDSDTFIFGSIEPLWNYEPLTVTKGYFHLKKGWNPKWFEMPLSSCVMLWDQTGLQSWVQSLPRLVDSLDTADDEISKWVQDGGRNQVKEEIALTTWVMENEAPYHFFDEKHVCDVGKEEFWNTMVVHTFSYNWLNVMQMSGRQSALGGLS